MMDYREGKNIIRRWKSEFQEIEFYYYAALFLFLSLVYFNINLIFPTSLNRWSNVKNIRIDLSSNQSIFNEALYFSFTKMQ